MERATPQLSAPTARFAPLSQGLPFFHRSYRDHSDCAEDLDEKLRRMRVALERLVGIEYETVENCIRAGMFYEKGMMEKAHFFAAKAVGGVHDDTSLETAFCAYMIFASALYAMHRISAADELVEGVHAHLLAQENAYLLANLRAFTAQRKFCGGDAAAARAWLASGLGDPEDGNLFLYNIYCHFTTAKAYIVTGATGTAIPFTEKLLSFCEAYNRPLDIIDASLLLSIALRKEKRAREADSALVRAVEIAQRYGFVQPFVAESAKLSADLGRLSHRLLQPQFKDKLDSVFVKSLYFATLRAARQKHALPETEKPRLSARQLELIRLLASGYSYQEISEKTGIKISTIKTYLRIAYQKLGAVNKREAVAKAAAFGLV